MMKKVKLVEGPKIAAYWTSPKIAKDEVDSLATFHLLIVDMENLINNPENLRAIKKKNPRIKILAYSNPMELFWPSQDSRPLQKEILEEVKTSNKWWLLQPDGESVIFWPGMRMLNLSLACPENNGERYNQFIAKFLLRKVLSDPIWDGYFMDNSGGDISWIGIHGINKGIDADNDGEKDDNEVLDSSWSGGIREFLQIIRETKGENFIMVGNKGTLEFLDVLVGKMFEEFPNSYLGKVDTVRTAKDPDGWHQSITNYLETGSFSIVQAKQIANTPAHRLFILASALLGDGYYAYGQNLARRFPEYRDIGQALSPAEEMLDGSWQREFSKATVKVWPKEKKGEIIYK